MGGEKKKKAYVQALEFYITGRALLLPYLAVLISSSGPGFLTASQLVCLSHRLLGLTLSLLGHDSLAGHKSFEFVLQLQDLHLKPFHLCWRAAQCVPLHNSLSQYGLGLLQLPE